MGLIRCLGSHEDSKYGGVTNSPRTVERKSSVIFTLPAEIFGMDGMIVLIVVVLVLFGSTQIPKLARSLGSAQKEFKEGSVRGESSVVAKVATVTPPVVVASQPVTLAASVPRDSDKA
jgi:sec-independent protein translocase protein TatA